MSVRDEDRCDFRTPQLYGRALPIRIWISSVGQPWRDSEVAHARKAISEAERWMEQEARARGVSLEFVGSTSPDVFIELPSLPGDYDSGEEMSVSDWIDRIAPYVEWNSPGSYLTELEITESVDHAHLLLLIRGEGRSYALTGSRHEDESEVLPVAACFLEGGGGSIEATTVVHETLHLYGAWDLYENMSTTADQAAHAARLFEDDIMRTCEGGLACLRVSDVTAWRLGWMHSGPIWFEYFTPAFDSDPLLLESIPAPPARYESALDSGSDLVRSVFDLGARGFSWLVEAVKRLLRRTAGVESKRSVQGGPPRLTNGDDSSMGFDAAAGLPGRSVSRRKVDQRASSQRSTTQHDAQAAHGHASPAASVKGARKFVSLEQLRSCDPWAPTTWLEFESLRDEVLAEHSLDEATSIARSVTPMPPECSRQGHHDPRYQELRIELATIRRIVERQGAAGVLEEQRLHRTTEEWRALVRQARGNQDEITQQQVAEVFKRSILILDSIQRRNSSDLRRCVLRFNHLRRQLGL